MKQLVTVPVEVLPGVLAYLHNVPRSEPARLLIGQGARGASFRLTLTNIHQIIMHRTLQEMKESVPVTAVQHQREADLENVTDALGALVHSFFAKRSIHVRHALDGPRKQHPTLVELDKDPIVPSVAHVCARDWFVTT